MLGTGEQSGTRGNRPVPKSRQEHPHTEISVQQPAVHDDPRNHLHNACSKSSRKRVVLDSLPRMMLRVRSLSRSVFPSPFNLLARRSIMSTPHRLSERPKDWKKAAPQLLFEGKPQNLSSLPVPKLEDTVEKLKESLVPIAWSKDELEGVYKKIDEFASTQGPELQKRLQERAEETPHWLEEWWDDTGYLGYRDSVSSVNGDREHPFNLRSLRLLSTSPTTVRPGCLFTLGALLSTLR